MPRKPRRDLRATKQVGVPRYIPPRSSDEGDVWRLLEWEFSELRDLVANMRLETLEEAIGVTLSAAKAKRIKWKDAAPRWHDDEVGLEVRAWQLIPFVDGINASHLQTQIGLARSLIPALEEQFATKTLTTTFLLNWGMFCSAAGAVRLLYFSESTPGHRRKGSVGGSESLDHQRRWFSHYFLQAYSRKKGMAATFTRMERFIHAVISGDVEGSAEQPADWFERFLNFDGDQNCNRNFEKLTGAFRDLSVAEMKRLAAEDTTGLPPLDWKLPPS